MIRPDRLDPERRTTVASTDPPAQESPRWRERWRGLRNRTATLTPIVFGVVVLLLGLVLWRSFQPETARLTAVDVEEAVSKIIASATPSSVISAQVYQIILPSLVVIQTRRDNVDEENGFGVGSGVVINSDAEILTALHIVDGADEIQVAFVDGTRTSAVLTSASPDSDIAVLTPAVLPDLVQPGTIGSASAMRVGDEVFAVGNPFGLAGSMSAGVVSGFEREFEPPDRDQPLRGLIQFDAAVNPGNSGGPLVDRRGQVVGIVTGLINPTAQEVFIGIGFAVPIDVAASAAGGPAR